MKLLAISVYDKKAQAYHQPYFFQNEGVAIRNFSDTVNSKDPNQISQHPEDFTLNLVGEFDDQTATLTNYEQVKVLVEGSQVLTAVPDKAQIDFVTDQLKALNTKLDDFIYNS